MNSNDDRSQRLKQGGVVGAAFRFFKALPRGCRKISKRNPQGPDRQIPLRFPTCRNVYREADCPLSFLFYISIDCTGVEDELDVTMAQRTELDYLIYNDPLGYADLILNGDPEEYLKNVAESHGLED